MMANKQLFSCYDISIPDSVFRTNNSKRIYNQQVKNFPFMRWPNGFPCEIVNMYFLDIACMVTGDTLKTYASELSHLVRYCASQKIGFLELSDAHIHQLSRELQVERSLRNPLERARNNNTVRAILSRIFIFLKWLQDSLVLPGQKVLIGEKNQNPSVTIQIKTNYRKRQGNTYFSHKAMPSPVSQEQKRPIPQSIIENIELKIEQLSTIEFQTEATLRKHRNNMERLKSQLSYVRARRRFMIWLMKRAGLRPSEMVEITPSEHVDILKTKRIVIPTKKRRRNIAPKRKFPITLKDSTVFLRYMTARKAFLESFDEANDVGEEALFLSVNGKPIKKTSLEKDFSRLVQACGYNDVKACFSMFRHRFITYEVIVHFKEFMNGSGKTRQLMTDADYRSILKRVAAKTGHVSEESLWHYIDLAWDEMDVWGNVDRAINRLHAADRLYSELLELRYDTERCSLRSKNQLLDFVISRLNEIIMSASKLE